MTTQSRESAALRVLTFFDDDRLVRSHQIDDRSVEAWTETLSDVDRADPVGEWWRSHILGRPVASGSAQSRSLRFVDLFSGAGGLAIGFRKAATELGFRSIAEGAVDQDAGALDVHGLNHSTRLRTHDSMSMLVDFHLRGQGESAEFAYEPALIREDWADLSGKIDAVLAGPPCQGHSNLNNQSRYDDRRNLLYLTVPAAAVALGAPMVIIENVPAVVHDRTNVVATATALLESSGYSVESGKLSAGSMGWPQARHRFFIVATKGHQPVDFEAITSALNQPPRPLSWLLDHVGDPPASEMMDQEAELSTENRERIDWLFDNDEFDLDLAVRPKSHREGTSYMAVYGRLHPDRPAPTITTGFMTPGRGRFVHPTKRRALTPREAARLQGFPDTFSFMPDPSSPPSKAQLTKWIGDAVPMPLGYAAGLSALAGSLQEASIT